MVPVAEKCGKKGEQRTGNGGVEADLTSYNPRGWLGSILKILVLFLVLSRKPNAVATKTADFIVSVGESGRREDKMKFSEL